MHIGVMGHDGLSDVTEMLVRGELWTLLTDFQTYGLVGVSPLGTDSERWFAEALLEHGGALELLDPPAVAPPRLLKQARAVHRLAPGADRTAALLGLVDELAVVWDGTPDTPLADAVTRAEAMGTYVHRIWPEGSAHA